VTTLDDDDLEYEESATHHDKRAELGLGALVCLVIFVLLAMLAFFLKEAWPSFARNGADWFGTGGDADQQIQAIFTSGDFDRAPQLLLRAWPMVWSTSLTTAGSVVISFVCSLFIAVFMVEFAPAPLRRVLEPVIRLLASVPSVIYGLIGVLVLVPFIGNHLITQSEKASVTPVIPLTAPPGVRRVLHGSTDRLRPAARDRRQPSARPRAEYHRSCLVLTLDGHRRIRLHASGRTPRDPQW
jgi:ABC-type phosphate transport system permease subunit